jgi:ADP-dependent NAD(P)H-hydrate dehydratase / NAD(P)H-hydrate epimerase
MNELLTVAQMARADALTIGRGTAGIELMENAGQAVFEAALPYAPDGRPVLVACSTGNNGGDGFVAARKLAAFGRSVGVAVLGETTRIAGDAAIALARWGGPVRPLEKTDPADFGLVVDALFGAGLDRDLSGAAADFVSKLNARGGPVVAVDLPSGIHGDSGRVMGIAVEATVTVTFFRRKPGHLLLPGRQYCGRTKVAQIGIADRVLEDLKPAFFQNHPDIWAEKFVPLRIDRHKYDRGHALVLSGTAARTGAARLAASAALRAGAGLVTVASPQDAIAANASHLTEIMLLQVADAAQLAKALADDRITSVALGPALGVGERTMALVAAALDSGRCTVLDADALTSLAGQSGAFFDLIRSAKGATVLTPHAGEFSRLFGENRGESKLDAALSAAKQSGAVVVFKGADTVIAAPDGRAVVNVNAPPWLATAGAGDVLTGIVCGLAAQGVPAFEAAGAAVWIHGEAARFYSTGMIAGDIVEAIPRVLAGIHQS